MKIGFLKLRFCNFYAFHVASPEGGQKEESLFHFSFSFHCFVYVFRRLKESSRDVIFRRQV